MEFLIDLTKETKPFPHFWERCVGSCHAATALREDWRQQLAQCQHELGFQYVRFHGLLDDDMSVYIQTPQGVLYSFYNIDSIFDFLLKIGMKPFIELSFMPHDLASGEQTCFHYLGNVTPPKDYTAWGALIETLSRHLVDRYGLEEVQKWYFEVWNEPNLNYFWSGTQAEYFRLYQYAAEAIKRVDASLQVGGPATAINGWVADMIAFCEANHLPLDFVSTHHYPTDAALGLVEDGADMEAMMAKAGRGILKKMAAQARSEAGDRRLYYTEWNNSPSARDGYHDDPYAAAFAVKTIVGMDGIVDLYSWWTFSDIFEEGGFPSRLYHGGFGLLNVYGIPKPSYQAFRLLHSLGMQHVQVASDSHPTVEALATWEGGQLVMLVYNHNVPLNPIQTEQVTLRVRGLRRANWTGVSIRRVDETHANSKRAWLEMGAPDYLNSAQLTTLMNAAVLHAEVGAYEMDGDDLLIRLAVPPHGVAAVTLVNQS